MEPVAAQVSPTERLATASRGVRFGIAAAVVLVAFVATLFIGRVVPHFVGDLFYLAIGAISFSLGPDAALLGFALAVAAVACLTPETPFPSLDDVLYTAIFATVALAMLHLSRAQRMARRLAEVRAREASAANEAKDRFLDLVSHDLRGPLNGIRLWTKILTGDRFNPATVQRAATAIDNSVLQQERLVGDLLDAARIRAGTVSLQLHRTPLHPILARVVETIAPAAAVKGLALEPPAGALDAPVVVDPDRLVQVFWNLLTNAVKFTDPGGKVAIVVERGVHTVAVHVRDTGRGLSAEDCRRAFEPYWQQQRGDGLGLGLLIARRLVELHGGALRVASPGPGQGADFAVELPLASSSVAA
jgi:signal transduction histidine kinase